MAQTIVQVMPMDPTKQMGVQMAPMQPVLVVADASQAMDGVAFANLANVQNLEFKQGNVFWEFASGGCAPNTYMIKDRPSDTPIFLMEEQSSCYCRACCDPAQPALVKYYNASFGGTIPKKKCCGILCRPESKRYNKAGNAVMTLEKPGLCGNCAQCGPTNMMVCASICQSEAWMHTGDIPTVRSPQGCFCCQADHYEFPNGEPGSMDKSTAFSHAQVPICGGFLTPTVNLMERENNMDKPSPWAVVEGPTCFGGCMDLCCTTRFTVSSTKGKSGDLAIITKKAPEGGCGLCIALCTPADTYNLDFKDLGITPQQKAAIIGEMVHLDFLFFEADQPICRQSDDGKTCYILLCTCYCLGALCPIQCCCHSENN